MCKSLRSSYHCSKLISPLLKFKYIGSRFLIGVNGMFLPKSVLRMSLRINALERHNLMVPW